MVTLGLMYKNIVSVLQQFPVKMAGSARATFTGYLVLCVIMSFYLSSLPDGLGFGTWAFALVALFSHCAQITMLTWIVLLPFRLSCPLSWSRVVDVYVIPSIFSIVSIVLYIDTVIYDLYHFHINNGVIWNILITPGAGDSFTIGVMTAIWMTCIGLFIVAVIIAGSRWGIEKVHIKTQGWRFWSLLIGLWFAVVLTDRIGYAIGDLQNNRSVIRVHKLYPIYYPTTIRKFATEVLGINPAQEEGLDLSGSGMLGYPKRMPVVAENAPKPHVIMIAIEGGRFDMLNAQTMPYLNEWAGHHLRFNQHFSGGNASRFGIFSMFYGIYATYWHSVVAERRSPVLIDALDTAGYDFQILSCTDLNFPEFRKTAFITIPEAITDSWACDKRDRDTRMTDEAIAKFVRPDQKPTLSWLFYDASHQPYFYYPEDEIHETTLDESDVNYLNIKNQSSDVRARYQNSLHYIDRQVGRLLTHLETEGFMDNTLIFIVGDHGEAFGELGTYGHNAAFDRFQTQTFCAAHVPKASAQSYDHVTSHMDIPATIFSYMGEKDEEQEYSQGFSLLEKERTMPPLTILATWASAALVTPSGILVFSLEGNKKSMSAFTHDWQEILDPSDVRSEQIGLIARMAKAMTHFDR